MKTWPFAVGASVLALTAGVLIAGLPASGDTLVLGPESAETVAAPPVAVAADPATPAPAPATVATSEAPVPVLVAMPGDADDVIATGEVMASTTTVAPDQTVDRAEIDLLVANGARKAGLAGDVAATLNAFGYTDIHVGNAIDPLDTTVIYFAPGFEDEAMRLAVDLALPQAEIEELPGTPLLADDSYAGEHLAVVLGKDASG